MLSAGLADVVAQDDRLLAIASASHAGTPAQVRMVRLLLQRAGLGPEALQNTPGLPLDDAVAVEMLRRGAGPSRLHQNCSGKHAAMLATCLVAGWPTESYLEPEHPLQVHLGTVIGSMAGERPSAVGVDGCGAPLFALSLVGLARAYRTLAIEGGAARRVAEAMRRYPELVDGPARPGTALMKAIPGSLAKGGAEGVYAAALPDGSVCTLKIDDGSARAVLPCVIAGLRALGATGAPLEALGTVPVLGHGRVVGEVRACFAAA